MRALLLSSLLVFACSAEPSEVYVEIDLELPGHFPVPLAPADNPLTEASVQLGRHLFYDRRLSVNQEISCSSCHRHELAFADDQPTSRGATGELGVLNAPSLGNVIYASPLTWAHGHVVQIEEQLLGPMFGTSPLEMGMDEARGEILERLREEPRYQALFAAAYPEQELDLDRVRMALASFVRSLVTARTPFDAYLLGDSSAISASARRGSELFYSARLGCSHCHAGSLMSTAVRSRSMPGTTKVFHNIGLYDLDGAGAYPAQAPGLIAETGLASDMGRFRVPSLRNVALTAPYGHDGSVANLEDFLRIYEDGGRVIQDGPHSGDSRGSLLRSTELKVFQLSDLERASLIAFLNSLSDPEFIRDPRHADPWP